MNYHAPRPGRYLVNANHRDLFREDFVAGWWRKRKSNSIIIEDNRLILHRNAFKVQNVAKVPKTN